MNHLTDDQLSARLDDALSPADRAAADAHLATCEACRERLAGLGTLDRSLATAMEHDPGDAYFASFSERVAARIAKESPPVPAKRWSFFSPRGPSFAGSLVALALVAGLVWLEFGRQDAGRALREAMPARETVLPSTAAPRAMDSLASPQPAAPSAPVAVHDEAVRQREEQRRAAPTPQPVPPSARESAPTARAQKVRTLPGGETVPAEPQASTLAGGNVAPPPGKDLGTTQLQQMKARAAGPATTDEVSRKGFFTSQKSLFRAGPSPAASPQPVAPGGTTQSLAAPGTQAMRADESTPLTSACGRITDSRGNGLPAASIALLGANPASAKSGPDGRYCLPAAAAGDTLVVLHVGFEPARVPVASAASLDVDLQPIGTLGSKAGLVVGRSMPSERSGFVAHDLYAGAPPDVRRLLSDARSRTTLAQRDHNAGAWERAARAWEKVVPRVSGAASLDARFQVLTAVREQWRIDPTPDRERTYRGALGQFIAVAPPGLPERATALKWRSELAAGGPR